MKTNIQFFAQNKYPLGKEQASSERKRFDNALKAQKETHCKKEEIALKKNLEDSQREYITAIYFLSNVIPSMHGWLLTKPPKSIPIYQTKHNNWRQWKKRFLSDILDWDGMRLIIPGHLVGCHFLQCHKNLHWHCQSNQNFHNLVKSQPLRKPHKLVSFRMWHSSRKGHIQSGLNTERRKRRLLVWAAEDSHARSWFHID